jgi:UDP-sulfoquinovose synthase
VADFPITVYGKGGQTRGYLNIKDTMQCVYLAASKPAKEGKLRVFNQVTEIFSVNQLAEKVKTAGNNLGYRVEIQNVENPRVEKEEHYYNPKYTGLLELGLKPHYLTEEVLSGMFKMVEQYKHHINTDSIFRGIRW